MSLMLGVLDTILNWLRSWSEPLQITFVFIFLLAMLLTCRKALKTKGDSISWVILAIILFGLFIFYIYAVF